MHDSKVKNCESCIVHRAWLTWSTASEINSDYFTVQRSDDGIRFNDIAKVKAAGNSTTDTKYEYIDTARRGGAAFYRLKETDADGLSAVSKILSLHCNEETPVQLSITSCSQ